MSLDLRSKRDLGRILDDAFSLYGARWALFTVVGLAVAVPVDVVVLGAGLGWLWDGWHGASSQTDLAPLALTNFLVTVVLTAMTVDVLVAEADGERRRARDVLRRGLESFGALVLPMLAVAVGLFAGTVAFVIPAVLVATFWAVVPQVVLVERLRGVAALRRSTELVSGSGWWTLGVQVTIALILGVCLFALSLGADALAEAADAHAITIAGLVVGQVVALPLLTLVTTLLYFSLRVGKGDAQGIPGRTAWERRLTEGWQPPV